MADFWGIEKYITDVKNDNAGWSLAVVHSEKGQRLLQNASLNCIEVDVCQALQGNHHSLHKKPLLYDKFWYDYSRSSFEYCLKKYTDYGGILLKIKRKVLEYLMMNW